MSFYKGIDVSYHQGSIDWEKVKRDGIQFAILRDGYGRFLDQKDKKFEENYKNAKAAGIPVGAYHYSYATDVEGAKKEAEVCKKFIEGKRFEYPIAYDVEDSKQSNLSRKELTEIVRTFCSEMEEAGYYVCIYASLSWLKNKLDMSALKDYDVWLAHWASTPGYNGSIGLWQNSSKGSVDGICGHVDTNVSYKNYPSVIKKAGLNGYKIDSSGKEIKELKAGDRIKLKSAPLYISSKAKLKVRKANGIFYAYDGKEINGRYRITGNKNKVGKKPVGFNVTGWINKEDAM